MDYIRPRTLADATAVLAEGRARVLAGGTDVFPGLQGQPLSDAVLDLSALGELRFIREIDQGISIGALARWSDVIGHALPSCFDALKQAAREVGSVQIQNRGTVAGNLCNASPAADGVPALMVLDAEVVLQSASGRRQMALDDFILGNRKTALQAGELLTEIIVPRRALQGRSAFLKLGARRYLVISIAMVAVRVAVDAGQISDCAIAVGACSAVAQRLRRLEHSLVGRRVDDIAQAIDARLLDGLSPIDDVRASAAYRKQAVAALIGRALAKAVA